MKSIDCTPTWSAILPMWQLIISRSCRTINRRGPAPIDGDGNFQRFWAEMQSMAAAADKWNSYCRQLEDEADVTEMQRVNEGLAPPTDEGA
jgi:hypothetical protein